MTMSSAEQIIAAMVDLLKLIQKEQKIGTAYERYESQFLWDLGYNIGRYAKIAGREDDVVSEIMIKVQRYSIHCQPLILKNAETITKVWPEREKYLLETRDVPYGKLRDALRILDPDFVAQHKVSTADRIDLIRRLSKSTFEDFRAYARELKSKYDPLGENIDFDEMFNDVYEATTQLKEIVDNEDATSLKEFRAKLNANHIEKIRKLIAAMKNEDTFRKIVAEINQGNKLIVDFGEDILGTHLTEITKNLVLLSKSSKSRRDVLRSRIGTSELGKLSTLLKAASSEAERQRYLRSRKMLERLTAKANPD